ncbi:MAG: geranylgeranylglyceryl/heptaprenylglyceryl phosphate synthase [Acidilobaceae archaeon]|nr:geranylgeranylglyceryl/heptaprenylglyceryl phosphate synthase [Acidilobaceae archaeon]MCX8164997.1 geranylgeranylglyceryl/heptaprenylglyceryl phosphate synthase [Acidilobaceae archaeon]MDW7974486.1 geranylgeranylglyceryl/heptaprenylglyceryl phosphate synthase [Sulfolobales archaeon]
MGQRIWRSMLEKRKGSRLHFTLIDPDKTEPWEAEKIARTAYEYGTDYVLVGGSLGVSPQATDAIVEAVKKFDVPVIIFPGALNNVSSKADAAFFLNIINSDDPYYHGIAQVQGSLIVLRHGLEPIPTCYVIVGYGGTAGYMARARPVPYEKPELVAAHSLACAMMGSKVIYLEAGSGAPRPVPPEAVLLSKEFLKAAEMEALLIVGGGIRSAEIARDLALAGADGIVTGTIVEQNPEALREIVKTFKEV